MKKIPITKNFLALLLSTTLLWACDGNRTADNTTERILDTTQSKDTLTVVKTGKTAEDQLADFREWMASKTSSSDSSGTNRGTETREEFKKRTAQVEARLDSLSVRSKAEYERLKGQYQQWEARQERRQQTPLDAQKLSQWQDQLLREYSDLSKITNQNARQAYLTFMGEVRAKRQNWTLDDWDYVDHVYGLLNQRTRQFDNQLATADKVKIKTLQAEFLTLEAAADTRSMLGSMRE
ncbi:hypothetical protein FVR03_11945 [Pontibacter qinzhouensis]|uniref:DUF349 domain-containing protein n=1 Tax=Pontibacter qinzhouensis TaxID=2603253 RepID=A0A5C8K5B5_9BACT|nr:hypothetical protein [Pontibacter qinzhouensis]TXK45798.1 hypothetical protein FVR03_11945 [Pontibacter qinzhouensis]